jgi:cell wall-associated NlpC family hydrolase
VVREPTGKRLGNSSKGTQMGVGRSRYGSGDPARRQPVRRSLRLVAPALVSGALVLAVVPPAAADKADHAFPTKDQVAAAKRHVEQATRDVGAIKASLLMANQRLEDAATKAEMASENYNGAMWRLDDARKDVASAKAEAARARRTVAEQRDAIGALVASSYQQGGDLAAVNALVGADGPEGVMEQYATFQGAHDSLKADYDRFAASQALAEAFERRAEKAEAKAERLAEEARVAKEQAAQAAAAAQATAAQIAAEKTRLIRELAKAQDISVSLARKRQAALEEIARERAAARARAEAERRAREQAARERAVARARARAEARAEAQRRRQAAQRAQQTTQAAPVAAPTPASPPPAPAPSLPQPPSGSGGADRAIAFAKAQLGEPYVWGAAGPDAWDCSGLMLGAWAQAGVDLPHYSVAQYYAGTPISVGDLRPGDLVFWGTTSSPSSIHHVAMYIGNGQIIHAPRTGRPVEIDSMYYWEPPNFFARL